MDVYDIIIEIFGYIGMALVLGSMMLSSLKWLRIVNMSGAVICAAYGILTNTWPTAFLNLGILIVQIVQLIRLRNKEKNGG